MREVISTINTEDIVIVSGDFSLPNIQWCLNIDEDYSNTVLLINVTSKSDSIAIGTCYKLGLYQINQHHNKNIRMLDVIWTNDPNFMEHLLELEVHPPPLEIKSHNVLTEQRSINTVEYRDFLIENYQEISNAISNINWNTEL